MSDSQTGRPATAAEIVQILGRIEDDVLASIMRTGATAAEILEAYTWTTADDALGGETSRSRRGAVGEVYEILTAEDASPDEA